MAFPVVPQRCPGLAGTCDVTEQRSRQMAFGSFFEFEGYGIIEEAGGGVDLKPGTRVAFFPGKGAWSEKATVPAEYVTEIPDNVSDEAAAQLHVNPLTTALLLRAVETSGAKRVATSLSSPPPAPPLPDW
ncbi:hypothetical protein [Agrobacterium tumefaciens]|uniref:hypothetical protein n=1 Tax=Agrobacterium tumefaciens TaxID=358 RepID=UPI001F2650FC|nr:hypothetical protein [Agrobacterium tumefaciens]